MASRDVLDEAYGRLHRSGPEFGGDEEGNNGLTNHGPMAVEVMVRRGLDIDVDRWLDSYVRRLVDLPAPSDRITEETWRSALGDGRRIADWTDYFARQVAERPWREVLVTWWPRLLPGIAAGATHGVIRVSHAVRALLGTGDTPAGVAELAYGLAFWAGRSRTLPGVVPPAGLLDAATALARVPHLPDQSGLIVNRLRRLADVGGWPESLAALRPPAADDEVPAALAGLVDAATARYLGHGHGSPVLLVHTATAPNAVLHTLPVLPRELWQASFAAAWAASATIISAYEPAGEADRARLPAAPSDSDPTGAVLARASEHRDEHVLKFADTAVEAYERTGDPDTLAAAVRVGQLIDPSR